jgi:carotenoid cleavage dioxygenase-like enzyme
MPLPRTILADVPPTDANLKIIKGKWPSDISGYFFLASPDPAFKGKHAFFADGVLYRLSLSQGTHGAAQDELAWRHSVLQTPSHRLHKRHPDIWRSTPYGFFSALGYTNAANTAQVPWGNRLIITWDAGRPVEVCPETMRFLGEMGTRKSWGEPQKMPILPMIATPAHPVVDPDRNCLWTCTYNPQTSHVSVVRIDLDRREVRKWKIKNGRLPQTCHTISQTRDWVIIVDNGYKIDMQEMATGERTTATNQTEPVMLINKNELEKIPSGDFCEAKVYEIGPETMHFYADYDDKDGVRIFFEHSTDSDIAFALRAGDKNLYGEPIDPIYAGMYGLALTPPKVTMMHFDPSSGKVKELASYGDKERYWNVQTSGQDWSKAGLSKPTLHHVMYNGWKADGISERQFNVYKQRIDTSLLPKEEQPPCLASFDWTNSLKPKGDWQFGINDWATSPSFAPRNAGQNGDPYEGTNPGGHDGYVIVPVLNDDGFRIELFDANKVSEGPVAIAKSTSKHIVPFVIHSSWMPATGPAPQADRMRFREDFTDEQLKSLPPELQKSVLEVADEIDRELDAL